MAKKRILLIQPPVEDYYSTPMRTYPLGLLYVAAGPLKAGHRVTLLDTMAGGGKKVMPAPPEFAYLKEFYRPGDKSPYRLFGHYYHFGLAWEEIAQRIALEKPDIIGVSSLFTPYHQSALKAAEIARKAWPDAMVVMGGHHVSVNPEKPFFVDRIIRGEGEKPFMDLLGEPLPEGPLFPARELIDPLQYTLNRKPMAFVLTSRGCPHGCAFCSVHAVFCKFEVRPVEEVLQEIRQCIAAQDIGHIDIEDDGFGYDRDHSLAVLRGISEMNRPGLTPSLMNGLCADVLDEEMLKLMRKAGFRTLNLSVISAQKETCRRMKRPFDPADFAEKAKLAASLGFEVIAYCILGLPGETIDDMLNTLMFLHALPVKIGPSIFYPVPATPVHALCLEKGYIKAGDEELFRLTAACVETPEFTRKDIMTLFTLSRILNLIKEGETGHARPETVQALDEFTRTRKIYHYFRNGRQEAAFSRLVAELFFEKYGKRGEGVPV
jgi:radical SAM superfamily enzyme YgiQ (UPF0313 family)